jgi:signal peptide peptidase-like protein 2B
MLNRFDRASNKGILNGYFLWLTVGYAIGMCLIIFSFLLLVEYSVITVVLLIICIKMH